MKRYLRPIALALALIILAGCGMFAPIPGPVDPFDRPPIEHNPTRESVRVTIPEGFNFVQIAHRLEESGVVSADAFFHAAQSFEVQSFATPFDRRSAFFLEGFLFPDTYEFFLDSEPNEVLRTILNNYASRVLPMMATNNTGFSDYEVLIIASIVEREARSTEHMHMVASVFYNRMHINMMMQANPTRYYARDVLGPSPWIPGDASHWLPLYDTYIHNPARPDPRLPIGPICNPGERAVYAVLNPASTDYLFFFFGQDHDNHYSRTYAEHNAAMRRVGVCFGACPRC
ncbi:MAG: endolytic transglycosylase MltG [Oscillospiraceae bacterium]|nr:endolytic transglycosylase MltG [Oscillospiraceae bacterium]